MSDQRNERPLRGPKGDQGQQGDRGVQGTPGIPRSVRSAIVFLFALSVLLAGLNILWTAYVVRGSNQQRCATVEQLATIPIPRPVAGHESREYAAAVERIYRARAAELGCPGSAP